MYYQFFLTILSILGVQQQSHDADSEKVIQMALDFPFFQEHLVVNEIIEKDTIWFVNTAIRDNGVIPSDLNLFFWGRKLIFKKKKKEHSIEEDAIDFRFNQFKLTKRKATIEYQFYPTWNMTELGIRRRSGLFILVKLELVREKGSWNYTKYSMKDVVFDLESEDEKWMNEHYKKLETLDGSMDP